MNPEEPDPLTAFPTHHQQTTAGPESDQLATGFQQSSGHKRPRSHALDIDPDLGTTPIHPSLGVSNVPGEAVQQRTGLGLEEEDEADVQQHPASAHPGKKTQLTTSKILGVGHPHKPRIGPQYQADIPPYIPPAGRQQQSVQLRHQMLAFLGQPISMEQAQQSAAEMHP